MSLVFRQNNICIFPSYVPFIRCLGEQITLGNRKLLESCINEYVGSHNKIDLTSQTMLPVLPIFLMPTSLGLEYTTANLHGNVTSGYISNEALGFNIDVNQPKKHIEQFLKKNLAKILKITSDRGHSIMSDHNHLLKYLFKFDGLCELISNYVIMNDLMGRAESGLETFQKNSFKLVQPDAHYIQLISNNIYQEKITVTPQLRHPERVFLREGSPCSSTVFNISIDINRPTQDSMH